MQAMLDEVKYCRQTIKNKFNKPLVMSPEDEDKFQKATSCHICGKKNTRKLLGRVIPPEGGNVSEIIVILLVNSVAQPIINVTGILQ